MISVMFTIIKVTVHGVRLPPWRSPPLSLSVSVFRVTMAELPSSGIGSVR